MEGNPLLGLLNEWTLAAVTLSPFVFQYAKALVMRFLPEGVALTKQAIAALHVGTVVGTVLWQGWGKAEPQVLAVQLVVAVLLSEVIYTKGVEPMADSSNPVVPRTSK